MVVVREAVLDDWQALRAIRLAALRDAPEAFLSSYAEQAVRGRQLYERCGFSLTGEIQPLPSNRKINEIGMICPL